MQSGVEHPAVWRSRHEQVSVAAVRAQTGAAWTVHVRQGFVRGRPHCLHHQGRRDQTTRPANVSLLRPTKRRCVGGINMCAFSAGDYPGRRMVNWRVSDFALRRSLLLWSKVPILVSSSHTLSVGNVCRGMRPFSRLQRRVGAERQWCVLH